MKPIRRRTHHHADSRWPDPANSWDTTAVPNGQYVVAVNAHDRSNNNVGSTMNLTVNN